MSSTGGGVEPIHVHIDADAEGRSQQYVAGRNQTIYTGPVAASTVTMRTLPRDVVEFTGRDSELRRLIAAAAGAADLVAIHTVDGMPGVGKTALVIRAAHLLADAFPDGQLFVDLHAHTPGLKPADVGEVLGDLLACTGMPPEEIRPGVRARAAQWRGKITGKKVLLVLDDAADQAQVVPLLPGTAGCLVLITSRRRLIALDGAEPLPLDTLAPDQAIELFSRLAHRTLAEPNTEAVTALVELCGYLPLAIAMIAGRLAHHPSWNITDFSTEFAAAQDRLAELAAGDRAVAAAFEVSYQALPANQQRLFCRLGLHPGIDIDVYATAALDNVSFSQARDNLEALYIDHLIDEPIAGRYRLHDLIREYTHTLTAGRDPRQDRDHAIDRLLDYYQHTAQTADQYLTHRSRPGPSPVTTTPVAAPDLLDRAGALTWMRTERANLLASTFYTSTHTQPTRAITFTAAMAAFLRQEGPWQQAADLHQAAANTARHHGDRINEANALSDLGDIWYLIGDFQVAANVHGQALALYSKISHRLGEANALWNLGRVRQMTGNYQDAADLMEHALALYQEIGHRLGEANALHELGRMRFLTADYPAAADLLEQSLALYRKVGEHLGEGIALSDLSRVLYLTANYPASADAMRRALALYQEVGYRLGEAYALHDLGRVSYSTGDYLDAAGLLERGLVLFRELGHRLGEGNALNDLGRVRYLTGDYSAAVELQEHAFALYEQLGHRHGKANALNDLGRLRLTTGDYRAADTLMKKALALFREVGDRQGETEVLNNMAALLLEARGSQDALGVYSQALTLARQVHSPLDEARALEGTARCTARVGDRHAARAALREAVAIYQRIGAPEATEAVTYLSTLENEETDVALESQPPYEQDQ